MRYRSNSSLSFLPSLGEFLRRLLAWRRPVPVPVPVRVRKARPGLTLVEMLVTMAITLVMMGAVVNVFARIGQSVNESRSTIEMASMLRSARQMLQQDLAGATCPTIPWTKVDDAVGYFEIVEGPATDSIPTALALSAETSIIPRGASASDPKTPYIAATAPNGLGDYDDVLAFTVRSNDAPFVGRTPTGTIKSNLAEIIWYAVENPVGGSLGEPGMRTVYRRVLLVVPDQGLPSGMTPELFFRQYDISARMEGTQWVANTLADLTKPANRFAHYRPANIDDLSPQVIDLYRIRWTTQENIERLTPPNVQNPLHPFGRPFEGFLGEFTGDTDLEPLPGNPNNRKGEDIVLTDVLGFDIRVYDPLAPVVKSTAGNEAIEPGDVRAAWLAGLASLTTYPPDTSDPNLRGTGAYVDLAYFGETWTGDIPPQNSRLSVFSSEMNSPAITSIPRNSRPLIMAMYDTWSFHFETDGIDQDNDNLTDEGTDGIDNPETPGGPTTRRFGVDDMRERETSPPYPEPLRGVQVRLRVYERDSRQVRETSVIQNFVPQ